MSSAKTQKKKWILWLYQYTRTVKNRRWVSARAVHRIQCNKCLELFNLKKNQGLWNESDEMSVGLKKRGKKKNKINKKKRKRIRRRLRIFCRFAADVQQQQPKKWWIVSNVFCWFRDRSRRRDDDDVHRCAFCAIGHQSISSSKMFVTPKLSGMLTRFHLMVDEFFFFCFFLIKWDQRK